MNKLMKSILIGLAVAVGTTLVGYIMEGWLFGLIAGLVCGSVVGFTVYFHKTDKQREEVKKDLELLTSEQIRTQIKTNQHFNELGEDLIIKRKELTLGEKYERELHTLILSGVVIMFLGLFYLGAIPSYFNVNNEMLNPTNISQGLNNSIDVVAGVGVNLINNYASKGASYPVVFFWLWWLAIFLLVILPILKIIYYTIKSILKGGKK